jgi:hypothetical protein
MVIMGKIFSRRSLVCAFALGFSQWAGHAQIINLLNNNSTAAINTGSSAGMFNWSVAGQNQLQQQWFYFRVGSTGGEAPINTISAPVNTTFNGTRGVSTVYANSQYSIQVDYQLTGGVLNPGGANVSDMSETITITKAPTVSSLDFHFFQYSDFDLGGPGNDTVSLSKIGSLYYLAQQTDPLAGMVETVNSPGANHGEVGAVPSILNELTDGLPTTLNDGAGPAGPGNVAWALEWDFTLNASMPSIIISKDKSLSIVPEPAPWALISVGVILFALYKRRAMA